MRKISAREFYSWGMGVAAILVVLITRGETSGVLDYILVAATFALLLLSVYKFIQANNQSTEHESRST